MRLSLHNVFQREIRGSLKWMIVGALSGVFAGTVIGCVYGHLLALHQIEQEVDAARQGKANFRLEDDGTLPTKVSSGIYAEHRAAGLFSGILLGTCAGFASGAVGGWIIASMNKKTDSREAKFR